MAFCQFLLGAPTAVSIPPLPIRYLHRVQRNNSYSYTSLHPAKSQLFTSSDSSSSSSSLDHNSTRLKPGINIPFSYTFKLRKDVSFVAATAQLFYLGGGGFGGFSGGVGGGGGGGRGGSDGGGGGFWSSIFSPRYAVASEEEKSSWDPHGLPANIPIILAKLSGLKRYKISELLFFDRTTRLTESWREDSYLFEMVSIRPGGVYTKAQLQKELEMLASCGWFERVDLDAQTKPDGTMGITFSFAENTGPSADSFRCINVGLMPPTKQPEMDSDMTAKEKMEFFNSQEREYRRRMDRSRVCLLPHPVESEIVSMVREEGSVSVRLLQRIRDEVQKWYYDKGYACATVVNFGTTNQREVVLELVEGDITKLVIRFEDKLGNVCEGNTDLSVIRRQLPPQVIRT